VHWTPHIADRDVIEDQVVLRVAGGRRHWLLDLPARLPAQLMGPNFVPIWSLIPILPFHLFHGLITFDPRYLHSNARFSHFIIPFTDFIITGILNRNYLISSNFTVKIIILNPTL
jgi:hypothetical protein